MRDLVAQRVLGLALGYEDLNDHNRLRLDSLLAVGVGKADPSGQDRLCERDKGKPLANSSTLNRLELTPEDADAAARYQKILADPAGMDRLLVDCFLGAHAQPPQEIWLDLDTTDDPIHARHEGHFFHGHSRLLLLFAVVDLLWRAPAVRTAAQVQYRCVRGQRRGV